MIVHSSTIEPNQFPQKLTIRSHELRADVDAATGGEDTAPDPHDYFDASLAACKTLTATWYAKKNKLPLERVEAHIERDASAERTGTYRLSVIMTYHGPLSEAERERIHGAVTRCPIHKLMTTTEVVVETVPLTTG
jgi:putative redox protein